MPAKRNDTVVEDACDDLLITRVFKVPRELLFECWSDPKHLAHWSGPRGFTVPHHSMDFRVGGIYRACLRSPEGAEHWVRGTYIEITRPERLVFTHAWEDEHGKAGPETRVVITFTEQDDGTEMTFRQSLFRSTASRDGHGAGWSSSFDALAEYLAKLP
jgi:uncharacterized protein YndB with AHSA1/START domain